MKQFTKTPGRVFLAAFLTTAGLLATAAPGLAAELDPVPLPAPSSTSAKPATAPGDTTPGGGEDPAGDSTGAGGWRSGGSDGSGGSSDSSTTGSPTDTSGGDSAGNDASGDPSSGSDKPRKTPTARQTRAEKDAAQRDAARARKLQHEADRKAAAARKSSAGKKKQQAARKAAAKRAAAKRMQQQARKAAQEAARREAAARKQDAARRSAVADGGDTGGSGGGSGGGGSSIDDIRQAVLDLTNNARRQAGCGSLRYSTQLQKSAQWMANDMSQKHYMSHTAKNGKDFDRRIRDTGFNGDKTGENLAEGFSSVDSVFSAWMHSPDHRRNILDCKFKIIGVGFDPDGGTWAQHFGG